MLLVDRVLANNFADNKGELDGSAVCERCGILLRSAAVRSGVYLKLYHAAHRAGQPDFCWVAPLFTQFCTLRRSSTGELADGATGVTDSLLAAERSAGQGTGNDLQMIHTGNVAEPSGRLAASGLETVAERNSSVSGAERRQLSFCARNVTSCRSTRWTGMLRCCWMGCCPWTLFRTPLVMALTACSCTSPSRPRWALLQPCRKSRMLARAARTDFSFHTTPCRVVSAAIDVLLESMSNFAARRWRCGSCRAQNLTGMLLLLL